MFQYTLQSYARQTTSNLNFFKEICFLMEIILTGAAIVSQEIVKPTKSKV